MQIKVVEYSNKKVIELKSFSVTKLTAHCYRFMQFGS